MFVKFKWNQLRSHSSKSLQAEYNICKHQQHFSLFIDIMTRAGTFLNILKAFKAIFIIIPLMYTIEVLEYNRILLYLFLRYT